MSCHSSGPVLWNPARLLLPALALLCAPGCETRLPTPPPPENFSGLERLELERVTSRYLDLAWSLHPSLALWTGGTGTGVPRLKAGRQEILAARREARNLLDQCLAVRSGGLPSSARLDQKVLAGLLRGLLVELEKVEPWSRDPGYYLDEIQACLALARALPDPSDQGESLRLQLLALPGILRDSEENLRFCPPAFMEMAARRARELSRFLGRGRLFPEGLEKSLAGEIRSAAEKARLALEAWAVRLEEKKSREPGGSYVLGEDTLAALLREKEGIYTPPAELARDLDSQARTLSARLEKALGDTPTVSALHALAEKALDRAGAPPPVELSPKGARAFCKEQGIFKGTLPATGPPLGFPSLVESLGLPAWPPGEGASSQATPALLLDLARATWPGFLALRGRLEENPSILRKKAPSLLFCLGWLSYAETLWAEKDPHPPTRTVETWHRLAECLQARAALGLHMGDLTTSQAARLLEEKAFLTEEEARKAVMELARAPLRHFGYIGLQSILDLRSSCRTREGRAFLAGAFHGKLLSCGALPAGAMEAELLLYCGVPAGPK